MRVEIEHIEENPINVSVTGFVDRKAVAVVIPRRMLEGLDPAQRRRRLAIALKEVVEAKIPTGLDYGLSNVMEV